MRHLLLLLCFLSLLCTGVSAQGNTGSDVRALEFAESDLEAYGILYEMVETMLTSTRETDRSTTLNFAKKLTTVADRINDPVLSGPAYYHLAQAHRQFDQNKEADAALSTATTQAMAAGDADLILRAVDQHNRLHTENGNYRQAAKVSQRALDYFVREGDDNSISRLQAELAAERAKLLRQQEDIVEAKAALTAELRKLTADKDKLAAENAAREATLDRHLRELNKTREQKEVIEQRAAAARSSIKDLSREALEQNALATSAREEIARQELIRQEAVMLAQRQSFRLYLALGVGVFLSLLAFLLYSRTRSKERAADALEAANRDLQAARNQSDELLENILPAEIAQELKATGKARARSFPRTTILFCDFVNFTAITEDLGAEALVRELDKCFKGFDRIVDQHPGVEKIKTIGDSYMVASGLEADPGPPYAIVEVALKMQAFLAELADARRKSGVPFFTGRIGLHTGPVVAGVVGARKFAYDVWGDTVNIASRIESESVPGKVNISAATQTLVKDKFSCVYRGKVEAKSKGLIDMYFVERGADAGAELAGSGSSGEGATNESGPKR